MDKNPISNAASCLKLLDIYRYSSSVQRFSNLHPENTPENMTQQAKQSFKAELLQPEPKDSAPDIVKILVTLGDRLVSPDEDNEGEVKPLAHFEADFIVLYEVKEQLKDGALEEFVNFNVLHNVWPFWREFVFSNAESMHLPKPDIPLMCGTGG